MAAVPRRRLPRGGDGPRRPDPRRRLPRGNIFTSTREVWMAQGKFCDHRTKAIKLTIDYISPITFSLTYTYNNSNGGIQGRQPTGAGMGPQRKTMPYFKINDPTCLFLTPSVPKPSETRTRGRGGGLHLKPPSSQFPSLPHDFFHAPR